MLILLDLEPRNLIGRYCTYFLSGQLPLSLRNRSQYKLEGNRLGIDITSGIVKRCDRSLLFPWELCIFEYPVVVLLLERKTTPNQTTLD